MSAYIDTHCHLDLIQNIQQNKQAENDSGIKTITVTNAPSFFQPNQALFKDSSNIRVALGLHPQLVNQYIGDVQVFEQLLSEARFIGEIGLDGTKDLASTFQQQSMVFEKVLTAIARSEKKVLTVHSRSAATETITQLHKHLRRTSNRIILHWFSGTITELKEAIKLGFYFSVNHRMVSTEKGRQIISILPIEKLLTETDAPFTFSKAIQTRTSSLVTSIKSIAEIKKIDESAAQLAVYENFRALLQ